MWVSALIQLISLLLLSSFFQIQSFLRVNTPFGAHPSQFPIFRSKLACTNFEAVLLLTSHDTKYAGRKLNRDLVPLKGFARSLKSKFNLA